MRHRDFVGRLDIHVETVKQSGTILPRLKHHNSSQQLIVCAKHTNLGCGFHTNTTVALMSSTTKSFLVGPSPSLKSIGMPITDNCSIAAGSKPRGFREKLLQFGILDHFFFHSRQRLFFFFKKCFILHHRHAAPGNL